MYDTQHNVTGFKMTILYLKQYLILFRWKGNTKNSRFFLNYNDGFLLLCKYCIIVSMATIHFGNFMYHKFSYVVS